MDYGIYGKYPHGHMEYRLNIGNKQIVHSPSYGHKYDMGYGKCPLPPLWIWSMECGKWNMENENCPLPPYWALL